MDALNYHTELTQMNEMWAPLRLRSVAWLDASDRKIRSADLETVRANDRSELFLTDAARRANV